jgi:hypothetical protein
MVTAGRKDGGTNGGGVADVGGWASSNTIHNTIIINARQHAGLPGIKWLSKLHKESHQITSQLSKSLHIQLSTKPQQIEEVPVFLKFTCYFICS